MAFHSSLRPGCPCNNSTVTSPVPVSRTCTPTTLDSRVVTTGQGPEPVMAERRLRPARPINVPLTLAPLRHGPRDPSMRLGHGSVWRATHTPDGPVTTFLGNDGDGVLV